MHTLKPSLHAQFSATPVPPPPAGALNPLGMNLVHALMLIVVWFASVPTARGQTAVTSFDQLQMRLKAGDTVYVTDTAGHKQKGKVLEISSSSLVLAVPETRGRQDYPESRVSVVERHRPDSVRNGALLGLGIGLGIGAVGAFASDCQEERSAERCALEDMGGLGAFGFGLGILIDAGVRDTETIYRAPSSAGTWMTIAPFVLPHRKGLAVTVSF